MKYILIFFFGGGVGWVRGSHFGKEPCFKAVEAHPVTSEPLFVAPKVIQGPPPHLRSGNLEAPALVTPSPFAPRRAQRVVVKFNNYAFAVA